MSKYAITDRIELSLGIASGKYGGYSSVNKFGRTRNADNGILTDIWDGSANAPGAASAKWVAPTQARVHAITSTSADDDGSPAGTGAQTIQVYGLPDWDTAETSEVVTINGVGAVNTVNSYVIIHRMKVLTSGASGPNAGIIKATAATDATVTAEIAIGEGQTQMAIYGIPSTKTLYITNFYASLNRAVAAAQADISLLWTPDVENQVGVFQVKHTLGLETTGTSAIAHEYNPYNRFAGPGILKLAVTTGQDNCDVSGGFDLILVSN